jgi:putative endonuclease
MSEIGELGEKLVGEWLHSQGWNIFTYRWRCRSGEIDLIACQRVTRILAFVEVKTRSRGNWDAGGILAVNKTKQKKICRAATLFLSQLPYFENFIYRFDVAIVSCRQNIFTIEEYIESAFDFLD